MRTSEKIDYKDDETILEAYVAYPAREEKSPVVFIVHDWSGRNDFACKKADALAELGYVGFALDMYGKGISGTTKEEKSALIEPFVKDRALIVKRIQAAINFAKGLPLIDSDRVGAMGFCFGGLCVLDLARSGQDIKGVVSFHGLLNAPESINSLPIRAKVLALHGYADPMAKPDVLMAFCNEMTAAKANWEVDVYGNTLHAFTNPEANDPDFGTVFNAQANCRSWQRMIDFFQEIFN